MFCRATLDVMPRDREGFVGATLDALAKRSLGFYRSDTSCLSVAIIGVFCGSG